MITISIYAATGWTIPQRVFYRDSTTGKCYSDSAGTTEISAISTPTNATTSFGGCFSVSGVKYIDATGAFTSAFTSASITSDTLIYIREATFANAIDYFGLSSSTLVAESSDSGENLPHTVAYNISGKTNPGTGESATAADTPASDTGIVWRNPTVSYRVIGDMTLDVTLGAAFKATNAGSAKPTETGYMIASVEIHTTLGEAPLVTVSAVANEGFTQRTSGSTVYYTAAATPAIKTYAVSIPISRRHRPQNLLSAISGGGQLQSLTLVARGDPVVVAENGMPCASDMTHGHIEVTATTAAYNSESAPAAGSGFTLTDKPLAFPHLGYKSFTAKVRKELT